MYKFLGARAYKFTPEGETQERAGVTIHLMEPVDAQYGVGFVPVKCGVSSDFWRNINSAGEFVNATGKPVQAEFNRYGKLVSLQLVASK